MRLKRNSDNLVIFIASFFIYSFDRWVNKKHPENHSRGALIAAIYSGDIGEVRAAIAVARAECVAWRGPGRSMSHDDMSERLYRYLTTPIPAWILASTSCVSDDELSQENGNASIERTPSDLAEGLGHTNVANYIIKEANKMVERSGRSKEDKKKQDNHRGKSTNERADLARQRLRAIQHKAEEDNPENKRLALQATMSAEDAEEAEEEERRTSSMGRVMSGRYS